MSWHVAARRAVQRAGIQPRYLRRLRWVSKARAVRRAGVPIAANLGYVLLDAEPDNFTYELENEPALASWVSEVCGCPAPIASEVVSEARADPVLAARLREATAGRWWWTKRSPPYGKRLAWYALARILRPALIIETGVHDGLGSLLLLRALALNAAAGSPGRLVSFDINPAAGWIVGSDPRWELVIESTRSGLPRILAAGSEVGLFIHDSLHTYENERFELSCAGARLADGGVLISDNAHATPALAEVCAELGLRYVDFHERPRGHFYPGGVMAAGVRVPRALGEGGWDETHV